MSISWPTAVSPAPALVALPVGAASLDEANAAIELWEHYKGRTLDDGQRLDVAVMLATRDDGLWAASVTGHEKPRQSGKGDSIEVVEFWGLTQRSERILHTIHDAVLLATETQSRMLSLLEHPDLRRLVSRSWKGTGQQMIEMRNGGIIWYRTRTGAGGRGVDGVDRLVVDEAQHAEQQHLNSITPTQAVSANPQLNVLGTGGLEGKSAWWWSLRKQAKGAPGNFGWVGYSAQPWEIDDNGRVVLGDVDPYDRDVWWATIPGLVAGRVSLDFLERELRVLGPEGFAQEYLCVWAPPFDEAESLAKLPADRWSATTTATPPDVVPGELVLGYDVHNGVSSVSMASGTLSAAYVEIVAHQSGDGWLPARLVELALRWKPTAIGLDSGNGPSAAILGPIREAFEDAGLDPEVLRPLSGRAYRDACGGFFQSVMDGTLRRPVVKPDNLDTAGCKAPERVIGDAFVWDRRRSSVPLAPLVAATVARSLLSEKPTADKFWFA